MTERLRANNPTASKTYNRFCAATQIHIFVCAFNFQLVLTNFRNPWTTYKMKDVKLASKKVRSTISKNRNIKMCSLLKFNEI